MNENAQKWVQALRSGEYKQGRGQLRYGDSFCCLGVACDVYAKETGQGEWQYERWFVLPEYAGDQHNSVLPVRVRNWLGLRADAGDYNTSALAADNDRGAPFEQIADTVEAEPQGLFR